MRNRSLAVLVAGSLCVLLVGCGKADPNADKPQRPEPTTKQPAPNVPDNADAAQPSAGG